MFKDPDIDLRSMERSNSVDSQDEKTPTTPKSPEEVAKEDEGSEPERFPISIEVEDAVQFEIQQIMSQFDALSESEEDDSQELGTSNSQARSFPSDSLQSRPTRFAG